MYSNFPFRFLFLCESCVRLKVTPSGVDEAIENILVYGRHCIN